MGLEVKLVNGLPVVTVTPDVAMVVCEECNDTGVVEVSVDGIDGEGACSFCDRGEDKLFEGDLTGYAAVAFPRAYERYRARKASR